MDCYCRQETMAYCVVANRTEEQKDCFAYEKASHENRCMWLSMREYCTNIHAQDEARYCG